MSFPDLLQWGGELTGALLGIVAVAFIVSRVH